MLTDRLLSNEAEVEKTRNAALTEKTALLIIEDDDVDAEALLRGLHSRSSSYDLHFGRDGGEAIGLLRNIVGSEDAVPCLVLLDLNMPGMNGLQFLSEIRSDPQLRSTVVFVFTTSDRRQDKMAAYDFNIAGYFLKSNMDGLLDTVDSYLKNSRFPTT